MGLVSSSGFANQEITVYNKTTGLDANYMPVTTWTEGGTYKACVYSKAMGKDYFGTGLWTEHTLYIAMLDYTEAADAEIALDSRISFNGENYAVEYKDNVAFQNEALFIGLKAVL